MSPPPTVEIEYSLDYAVKFLHGFLDARGYQKAILCGNSMGGGISLKFAIDYPQRTEGVILANAVGLGREIAWSIRLLSLPGVARFALPSVTREQVLHTWRSMFFHHKS
jgi:pimeloyl-ACP methyl ester carboxylesterase